ncbi:sel1 repeat family protein [Pseudidiomarina andamanensis]|uniref:Sel1 repeat family protein n=1 Tax=Pseudidiomarina andamanensis TaxID=1940690 RepID=A0AA92EU65_9GAMM|nr:sel1 repeat family protein [Pseudidiomarina andamanensis]MDS0217780.1 sel1 repeat family protein [Pseudidiomarina andamanensis]QGT94689.1 sel1 repeat family protein [Pseudidiomarina andamanensis]
MSTSKKWVLWGFVGVPVGAVALLFTVGVLRDFGLLPERLPWHASAAEKSSSVSGAVGSKPVIAALGDKEAPTPMGAHVAQHWTDSWLRNYDIVLQAVRGDKAAEARVHEVLAYCRTEADCPAPENSFTPISNELADVVTARYLLGVYFVQQARDTGEVEAGNLGYNYLASATNYKHPAGAFAYAELYDEGKIAERDTNVAFTFYREAALSGYFPAALRAAGIAESVKSWKYALESLHLAQRYPLADADRAKIQEEITRIEHVVLKDSLVTAEELPRTIRLF